MSEKKITITADTKLGPGIQQLVRTFDQLEQKGAKVSKAFAGISGGTGTGTTPFKSGALAKGLLEQTKLFDALGKSGEKLSKILNEQVGKSQNLLTKQLETSTKGLDGLIKQYENAQARVTRLQRGGADPARVQLAQAYQDRALNQLMGGAADVSGAASGLAAVGGGGAAGGGMGGGGIGGALIGTLMSRAGLGGFGRMLGALGPAGILMGAGAGGLALGTQAYFSGFSAPIASAGHLGGTETSILGLARGGDLATAAGLDKMRGMDNFDITYKNKLRGVAAAAKNLVTVGIAGGFDWDATVLATQQDIAAIRAEGRPEKAKRVGESGGASLAALQKRVAEQPHIQSLKDRFGVGTYEAVHRMSANDLIDEGTLSGYLGPLSNFVGNRSALGYLGSVAGLQRAGMDPGRALSILGQTAVGGGNVLGYTAGMDPAQRAVLGEGVAGTMGIRSMMFAGAGGDLSAALAGSVSAGGAMGMRQANQAVLGSQMYGASMGGKSDPFQMAYNVAAASAVLPDSADPYTRNALATQLGDPKVLAAVQAGRLPKSLEVMGITLAQAQAVANDIDKGLISSRWFDTGSTSKAANRVREIAKVGRVAYMRNLPASERALAIEEAAPLLAQIDDIAGGDVGAEEGRLRFATGMGGLGRRGGRGRGGTKGVSGTVRDEGPEDTVIREQYRNAAQEANMLGEAFKDMRKESSHTAKGLSELREQLRRGLPVNTTPNSQ